MNPWEIEDVELDPVPWEIEDVELDDIEYIKNPYTLVMTDQEGNEVQQAIEATDPSVDPSDIQAQAKAFRDKGFTVKNFIPRASDDEMRTTQMVGSLPETEVDVADWDSLSLDERAYTLAQLTGASIEDAYAEVTSSPYNSKALYEAKSKGEDYATTSNIINKAKDWFSSGGRVLASLYGDPNTSFIERYAQTGEESDNIAGSIMRDPYTYMTAGVGLGGGMAAKAPAIGNIVNKASLPSKVGQTFTNIGRGLGQGAIEGGAEELLRAGLESVGSGQDVDWGQAGIGTGASALFGGVARPIQDMSFNSFFNSIPSSTRKKFGITPEQQQQPLFDTYRGLNQRTDILGQPKGYGTQDYDYPARIADIKKDQSLLGAKKEEAYKKADDLISKAPPVATPRDPSLNVDQEFLNQAVLNKQAFPHSESPVFDLSYPSEKIKEQVKGEMGIALAQEQNRLVDEVVNRNMSLEYANEYAEELSGVVDKYFKKLDIPKSAKGTPLSEGIEATTLDSYEDKIIKLFNSRKAMDKDLERVYNKLGKGVKLDAKEEAFIWGRTQLNNMIDVMIETLKKEYPKNPEVLKLIDNALQESKALPSLYNQEAVLFGTGGVAGRSIGDLTNPIKAFGAPASGKRSQQFGNLLQSNFGVLPIAKEALYRDEESIFGE